jgi:hypothetical protein
VNEMIVGKTVDVPAGGAGAKVTVKGVKTFTGDATVVGLAVYELNPVDPIA